MIGWLLIRIGHALRLLLGKERSEQQLDEEMSFHLQRQIEQNIASGMNPEEGRLAALRLFGGVEQIKEECRDMRGTNFIENLLQDLRYGVRMLAKNPTFAAVAVVTLALGIGANTAIFSVVNAVLLRPLPYPRSDAIVEIKGVWKDGGLADDLTVPEFEFYRDHASAFAAIAGYRGGPDLSIKRGGVSEWITSLRVTDGFFKVLGVAPALGRGVLPEETRPGSAQIVILSDSLWRKAFGSDPAVIGQQVVLGDASFTVVGVMPPDFTFVEQQVDVFIPLQLGTGIEDTGMNTSVIARLQPATSLAQAQANMNVVFEQFRRQVPRSRARRGIGCSATRSGWPAIFAPACWCCSERSAFCC